MAIEKKWYIRPSFGAIVAIPKFTDEPEREEPAAVAKGQPPSMPAAAPASPARVREDPSSAPDPSEKPHLRIIITLNGQKWDLISECPFGNQTKPAMLARAFPDGKPILITKTKNYGFLAEKGNLPENDLTLALKNKKAIKICLWSNSHKVTLQYTNDNLQKLGTKVNYIGTWRYETR